MSNHLIGSSTDAFPPGDEGREGDGVPFAEATQQLVSADSSFPIIHRPHRQQHGHFHHHHQQPAQQQHQDRHRRQQLPQQADHENSSELLFAQQHQLSSAGHHQQQSQPQPEAGSGFATATLVGRPSRPGHPPAQPSFHSSFSPHHHHSQQQIDEISFAHYHPPLVPPVHHHQLDPSPSISRQQTDWLEQIPEQGPFVSRLPAPQNSAPLPQHAPAHRLPHDPPAFADFPLQTIDGQHQGHAHEFLEDRHRSNHPYGAQFPNRAHLPHRLSLPDAHTLHLVASNQDPPMAPDGGLAVLSAEQYDAGTGKRMVLPRDGAVNSRKRTKAQASDGVEAGEEEKKRARGRPRLDAQDDQTAVERRRTQIRLAQRAYRNRKESAIQTLEKKVQGLKDSNDEMIDAFMKLHDFAVGKGILDSHPEFGQQLKTTTQKFLALADSKDDNTAASPGDADRDAASKEEASSEDGSAKNARPAEADPPTSRTEGSRSSATQPKIGPLGYIFTHETEAEDEPQPALETGVPTSSSAQDFTPNGYEVITHPTPYNASFPYGAAPEASSAAFLERKVLPSNPAMADSSGSPTLAALMSASATPPPSISPYASISTPLSFAYQERSFGRRFQRSAVELGLSLASMPNPPPHLYAAVFGFCLLFEPKDMIITRLSSILDAVSSESMNYWRYPFVNLGGTGTFFPETGGASPLSDPEASTTDGSDGSDFYMNKPVGARFLTGGPIGNLGLHHKYRPEDQTGFSMGPFSSTIENVRDTRVDKKLRIMYPGFEGDFFDPDDVEIYLRKRGVHIPVAADFVEVEVDVASFTNDPSINDDQVNPRLAGLMDSSSAAPDMAGVAIHTTSEADPIGESREVQGLDAGLGAWKAPGADPMVQLDPAQTLDLIMDAGVGVNLDSVLDPNLLGDGAAKPQERRKLIINVETFVNELVHRSVCLGRSPGVRPKDVNAAFWRSTYPVQ